MILLAVGSELFPFCAELCSTWGWTNIATNAGTILWAWLSRIWSNNHISYRSGWECLDVSENLQDASSNIIDSNTTSRN